MNIFRVSEDPYASAVALCDKHVVKMILESAQLLCTAHRVLDGKEETIVNSNGRKQKVWVLEDECHDECFYKATHVNHPSAIWVRESVENYNWLCRHLIGLILEYEYRYGKWHKVHTDGLSVLLAACIPKNIPHLGNQTPFKMAMPEECKDKNNTVASYRNYYCRKQSEIKMTWKKRMKPLWMGV